MSEARRFARRAALFCAPLALALGAYLIAFTPIVRRGLGPTADLAFLVERQARGARERDYRAIVLGNSRLFRGFDPRAFSIASYDWAFDDDSLDYVYYKLRQLIRDKKKPAIAIIGLDHVALYYRNVDRYSVYRSILKDDEFQSAIRDPGFAARFAGNWVDRRIDQRGLFRNAAGRALRGGALPEDTHTRLRDDGFLESDLPALARVENVTIDPYRRDPTVENWLQRIAALCRDERIRAAFVLAPERAVERAQLSDAQHDELLRVVRGYAQPAGAAVFDHMRDPAFDDRVDFYDASHLTADAARRFTRILDGELRAFLASAEARRD